MYNSNYLLLLSQCINVFRFIYICASINLWVAVLNTLLYTHKHIIQGILIIYYKLHLHVEIMSCTMSQHYKRNMITLNTAGIVIKKMNEL